MSKSNLLRKRDTRPEPKPRPEPVPVNDSFVARLAKARTANEMTSLIGLKPIKGRSGPKIAY
ncbi:hypothetical protein O4J55_12805 [Paracoccus sp. PXZ]|uniref:hypothetical protein n=1 Tax=Paracoccus sp. MKU1 TaxID=1745182 RepID=UPI0007191511|nr:hypothetical protein [Paracoccus sp. MKU1]KRW94446.1 hypothetical protein AQY21_19575 [Paracoccus sp. MKU1]